MTTTLLEQKAAMGGTGGGEAPPGRGSERSERCGGGTPPRQRRLRYLPLLCLLLSCSGAAPTAELKLAANSHLKVARCDEVQTLQPLLVEWPATDRAALEARLPRGTVVVKYKGCSLRVLRGCVAPGTYGYQGITRKKDRVLIRNSDELYAQMPLSAVKLEATLAQVGEMQVDMSIVGAFDAQGARIDRGALEGFCNKATHYVTAAQVGAFAFKSGARTKAAAGATMGIAGGGARTDAMSEVLSRDGDEAACNAAKRGDKTPPEGCGALLRVELAPIAPGGKKAAPKKPVKPAVPVKQNCQGGSTWNGSRCECPADTAWDGHRCVKKAKSCPGGSTWDGSKCACPPGSPWNGTKCAPAQSCPGGSKMQGGKCVCPAGTKWNGTTCAKATVTCSGGAVAQGDKCVCPSGTSWNGTTCVAPKKTCPAGTTMVDGQCQGRVSCPAGTKWNGSTCEAPVRAQPTPPRSAPQNNGLCPTACQKAMQCEAQAAGMSMVPDYIAQTYMQTCNLQCQMLVSSGMGGTLQQCFSLPNCFAIQSCVNNASMGFDSDF